MGGEPPDIVNGAPGDHETHPNTLCGRTGKLGWGQMTANKSVAHRLGRVLEKVTRQSGRLPDTPDFGSWLLGKSSESQLRRRVRIQVILTVFILSANLLGIAVALLLVIVAFPVPSVFSDAPFWITWVVCPEHRSGTADRHLLDHPPDSQLAAMGDRGAHADARGSAQRVSGAVACGEGPSDPVGCWDGAVHDAVRLGEYDVHSAVFVHHQLRRRRLSTACYLLTEFALRPVAAQALEAGPPQRRLTAGIMGRLMSCGCSIAARRRHRTARGVRSFIEEPHPDAICRCRMDFGDRRANRRLHLDVDRVLAHRDPGTRRASRTQHVEQGDLDCNVVVFDGTELGELQRGFNSMVAA